MTNTIKIIENYSYHSKFLQTLKPGQIPEEIFIQFLRLFPATSIEIVPLRFTKGKIQVLMTKRPPEDPVWPNLWHVTGTMLSTTDKTYQDAVKRVIKNELNSIGDWEDVGFATNLLHKSERGMESAVIYYLELPFKVRKPENSKWFDRNNLPKDIIQSHKKIIDLAVKSYLGIL